MHTLVMCYFPGGRIDNPLFRCACWAVASGVKPGIWTVTFNADKTRASFSPSINWPGHFHDYFRDVPVATSMDHLFVNPEWA